MSDIDFIVSSLTPKSLTGTEPPAQEPIFTYRFSPCVAPQCGSLNRRLATEPAPTVCPRCGGRVLGPLGRVTILDGERLS